MKKITVKTAKQQTVLELSDDICCYHYKTALTTNVTKKFKLEEIKRIECSGKEKREWIYLKNSEKCCKPLFIFGHRRRRHKRRDFTDSI